MSYSNRVKIVVTGLALLIGSGCASVPTDEMSAAQQAILDARGVKDCASEKFLAAQRLLEEAEKLVDQEKYDEAKRKAKAAEKIAIEAKKEGELNWDDCQRRAELARQAANADKNAKDNEDDGRDAQPEEKYTLGTVYFEYDSAGLSDSARSVLAENVKWMKQNKERTVTLEGHTDERGTPEYNLSLGESRARQVKSYLKQLGVDENRLYILSYGEEMPAAYGSTASDYAKNRRVEFVPK
ncbi:OmpA family protein [Bradymonas sediminis]|uniref:Peptidoglycan-associated lipoprotein n=1 Tax=Bradymonas sediminis TaxID=1548548 RepID=A0A2Z4FIY6_9DELT|nr:OmpA family protein [Bradymonas sediminis]AWV88606.1 hypothetical protein DN745_04345 [Bradymonas sediminis]TDP63711.1 peptidoglycan-associated lipoprotein [Bradymonas sediminis]